MSDITVDIRLSTLEERVQRLESRSYSEHRKVVALEAYEEAKQRRDTATPPLAPCEPSAEPPTWAELCAAVKAAETAWAKRQFAGEDTRLVEAQDAAVRALCLRAREAPTVDVDNLVNFVTSYIDNRSACVPQGPGPVNPWSECRSSAANAIRDWFDPMKGARSALFVKEKLT